MKLSREEVIHIALLARVGMSETDVGKFQEQLSHILEQFEVLQQVDTNNVPPFTQATPMVNVTRQDHVTPSLPQDEVLANAPQEEDGLFKVKAILE